MRAVVPARARARVRVDGEAVGEIGAGLCVLLGVARGDGARTPSGSRPRSRGCGSSRTTRAASTAACSTRAARVLVVSQFTLIADTAKGNRPSFTEAAPPEEAEPLYERFCEALAGAGRAGRSAASSARSMLVELVNDGPVTIVL